MLQDMYCYLCPLAALRGELCDPGFSNFDYRELCGDEEPIQEDQDEDQRDADSIVHVDTPRLVCGTSSMPLLRGSSELFIWCTKDSRGSRLKLKGSGDGRGADILKLSLIHISEPTRRTPISYAVFCLKKKKRKKPVIRSHTNR